MLRRTVVFGLCLFFITLLPAFSQSEPNLENGFKPYGSFAGNDIDSVNLMNGGMVVHAPLPYRYPQRGQLDPKQVITVISKNWTIAPAPAPNTSFFWSLNSQTISWATLDPILTRSYVWDDGGGSGAASSSDSNYVLTTWDGATHSVMRITTAVGSVESFEAIDGSGWQANLTNPDSLGTPQSGMLIDRAGNQYFISNFSAGRCAISRGQGAGATTTKTCTGQAGLVRSVTDPNGNIYTFLSPSTPPVPGVDTIGRSTALISTGIGSSDTSGCISSLPLIGSATISYPAPNGATNSAKICYASITPQTSFNAVWNGASILEFQNWAPNTALGKPQVVVSILLQDGTNWTFNYNSYGDIISIGLPLGGSIAYQWASVSFPSCSGIPMSRAITSRTVTDNKGNSYTWNYKWLTQQASPLQKNGTFVNVVTDPLNNDVAHTFTNVEGFCSFYETTTQTYQGSSSSGTLLKRVDTSYSVAVVNTSASGSPTVLPISIQTTVYPSGKVSLITKEYDKSLPGTSYGKITKEKEYDWGSGSAGALLREVDTSYFWQSNSSYLSAHLLDLPASVITRDSGGCVRAETDYNYDEPAYLTSYTGSLPAGTHVSPSTSVRGNPTSTVRWLIPASGCNTSATGTTIATHTNWYDIGETYQKIDALGYTTTHSYDPAYGGAYSTKTCNALNQCVSGTYDFNTGLLASFTDQNATSQASGNTPGDAGHTSTFAYDFMGRMTTAGLPDGGQSTFNYTNATTRERLKKINASLTDDSSVFVDGLGRPIKTQHVTPNGSVLVDTAYDAFGRANSVSNPYITASDPTAGTTATSYDALGRVLKTSRQDGSFVTSAYSDNCTTVTDEAGKARKSCSDGLGRLTSVFEDPTGLNYETDYQYDVLGNLLRVDQKGSSPSDSTQWRTRLFTYDSLSRLLTASNPESGTISYQYDANGNMKQKIAPAPNQTGSATVTTTYAYDVLNRITSKTYADGTTPSAYFAYDGPGWWSDVQSNVVGRLQEAWIGYPCCDTTSATIYGYDAMGRVVMTRPITPMALLLSSNWVVEDGQFGISASKLAPVAGGFDGRGLAYWGGSFSNDQFAQVTLASVSSSSSMGPAVRVSPSGLNYYAFGAAGSGASGNYWLWKTVNGARTTLATGPTAHNVNDVLRLEVTGTTLTAKINGTVVATVTDSTFQSGNPGIQSNPGVNPGSAPWETISNWTGGTFSPAVSYSDSFTGVGPVTKMNYTYDLAGNLTSYDGGADNVTFTQTFDSAGRVTQLTSNLVDATHPATIATVDPTVGYYPNGALRKVSLGNGLTETSAYNKRLQPCRINVNSGGAALGQCADAIPSGNVEDFSYGFNSGTADNGNIATMTATGITGTQTFNRSYTYDSLNRLQGMTDPGNVCTGLSWTYDSWGNRLTQSGTGGSCLSNSTPVNAQNRLNVAPYQYDAAGNLIHDASHSYTYDAENRLIAVDGGSTASYIYDAEGRRVRKTVNNLWTDFIYDPTGNVIAEYENYQGSAPIWSMEYMRLGGLLIAEYTNRTTYFFHQDHLGSTRLMTNLDKTIYDSMDYLPFGEQILGGSGTTHKFTGKERDGETNLDYFGARYHGSSMGRFMSFDSLNTLDLSHPQKLNRYTYANNNPLANIDVGGHCTAPAVSGHQVGICVESYIRSRFLPGALGKFALGDNRGPNPHGGSFRTQTLLSVDPSTHDVRLLNSTPGKSCAIEGCITGVNNSSLSKISHDDKGNTYFTLTVYGENGYEAQGKTGAPGGWIEMQFSFAVNSKGEITIADPETKGYPSVSIYSYDAAGDVVQDVFQQRESGNIQDLWGPRKPTKSDGQKAIDEEAARQCALGNRAACDH
ncbi:MAG TPA: RHS repeat-associated core domain-containing protein [Candidatus Angelobacter sp.]|nr:RHS repeat-associated core domain-containing protein [Candidatus Angelobacter sp.]